MIPTGVATTATALFLLAAACLPGPRSGIEGETVIGPTRPVVRVGDPRPDEVPYPTTLLILAAADGRPVARVTTDKSGRFKIDLPPGEYRVTSAAPKGRALPHVGEENVRVDDGKVTFVTIRFDSGLR